MNLLKIMLLYFSSLATCVFLVTFSVKAFLWFEKMEKACVKLDYFGNNLFVSTIETCINIVYLLSVPTVTGVISLAFSIAGVFIFVSPRVYLMGIKGDHPGI